MLDKEEEIIKRVRKALADNKIRLRIYTTILGENPTGTVECLFIEQIDKRIPRNLITSEREPTYIDFVIKAALYLTGSDRRFRAKQICEIIEQTMYSMNLMLVAETPQYISDKMIYSTVMIFNGRADKEHFYSR